MYNYIQFYDSISSLNGTRHAALATALYLKSRSGETTPRPRAPAAPVLRAVLIVSGPLFTARSSERTQAREGGVQRGRREQRLREREVEEGVHPADEERSEMRVPGGGGGGGSRRLSWILVVRDQTGKVATPLASAVMGEGDGPHEEGPHEEDPDEPFKKTDGYFSPSNLKPCGNSR
ncbi:hypothetical protein BD779DRAFT_1469786 [Infundibulicybe gibba]|nr:hypothetical protein BD779DRAFT_1469786 [Infundibulicybe gibba]